MCSHLSRNRRILPPIRRTSVPTNALFLLTVPQAASWVCFIFNLQNKYQVETVKNESKSTRHKTGTVISNRIGIPNFLIRAKQFNYKIKFHVSSFCFFLFSFYFHWGIYFVLVFVFLFVFSPSIYPCWRPFLYGLMKPAVCLSGCEPFLTQNPLTKGYCRTVPNNYCFFLFFCIQHRLVQWPVEICDLCFFVLFSRSIYNTTTAIESSRKEIFCTFDPNECDLVY